MKKLLILIITCLIANILFLPHVVSSAISNEIIEKRTETSKTYWLGGNKYALDSMIGAIHYKDIFGNWQDINNAFVNEQMLQATYNLKILQKTFNQGQILEYSVNGETVKFQPMNLQYTNDLSQIQQISSPQTVSGQIVNLMTGLGTNPNYEIGKIKWLGAYGVGRNFEWISNATRLTKILTISGKNDLPLPQAYIINGGNAVVEQQFIFAPSVGLSIYIDGLLWDKSSKKITANNIVFKKGTKELFEFVSPLYYDSSINGNSGTGKLVLNKSGQNLYVSVQIPYVWTQTATYPIYIDPTIDVETDTGTDDGYGTNTGGFDNTGWAIYVGHAPNQELGFYMFAGTGAIGGTTIDVAYINLYFRSGGGGGSNTYTKITANDVEIPTAPTNQATLFAKVKTTNGVDIDGTQTANAFTHFHIETVIQELATSYAAPDPILILHDDDGSTSQEYTLGTKEWHDVGGECSQLHIEYTTGAGVVTPTVVTGNATAIEETTATLQGNIINAGGENCTEQGFEWDTVSGIPYSDNQNASGNFGTGNFTANIVSLTKGELYYFRASANNSAGWGYGAEVKFITKPDPATSFVSTGNTTSEISLSWTNGTGMDYAEIRYAEDSAPTDNISGTLGYWGNGTSTTIAGLNSNTTYFFRIFTHVTESGLWSMSDNNPSCQGTTDSIIGVALNPPTYLTLTQVGVDSINATWVKDGLANTTILVINTFTFPIIPTGDYLGCNITGNSFLFTGLSLETNTYYFSAWSQNSTNYSATYVTASIGGKIMLQLGVIFIGITLIIVAFLLRRGLIWAIPLAYHCVAFYFAYQNSWESFYFVPLGGFALISLIVLNIKLFKGDII